MPKQTSGTKFDIESVKDPDLRAYVRHLSASLDKQNQELKVKSFQNNIYRNYFQFDDLQQLIKATAEGIQIPGCSSSRILISHETEMGISRIIVGDNGRNTQDYAYLDEQIIRQLQDKSQLIIGDTTKIHSIKFSAGKKYPKTIGAYHFYHSSEADGYFWITFETVKKFSLFEIELHNKITTVLRDICAGALAKEKCQRKRYIFEQMIASIHNPVLVLSENREIVYSNQVNVGNDPEYVKGVYDQHEFTEWLDSQSRDYEHELHFGNQHYQILGKKIVVNDENAVILNLQDDTYLYQKQAYLKLIMDTISHDFRVPLINMQGFSKLLSMVGELNEKQTEYLELISNGVEDVLTVVEDLFDVERIIQEHGLKLERCLPKLMIERAVALIQAEARQKRIDFENTYTSEEATIVIDRVLVISAIYNMLNNAVKNSRIGGTIIVEETIIGDTWKIAVQDRGKGISQIDVKKLEEDHFAGREGKGLSIVDRIARFHNGQLKVESELGKGSKFIFEIPIQS